MTGHSHLVNFKEQCIPIAIQTHLSNILVVAAGLPLQPESLPLSAVKPGLTALQGAPQRLLIHPGHHQNLVIFHILHNCRNQAGSVKFNSIDKIYQFLAVGENRLCFHSFTGTPLSARYFFTSPMV